MCMAVSCRKPLVHMLRPLCTRQFDASHLYHTKWTTLGPATLDRRGVLKTALRGVKTRAKLQVHDLPQGPIAHNVSLEVKEDGAPTYPTVVQQAKNNMLKFDHCVLLTRVGGFYEV